MQPWFTKQSREVRLIIAGLALLVIAGVVVALVTSGSGGKSSGEESASAAEINELADEVEEEEAEGAEEAMNPSIPHNLNEVVIAHPKSEEATTAQLAQQIKTNELSNDPTHQQEASCSYLSEYGVYVHYSCIGYAMGGQSNGIGQIEVTVDRDTGEVLVEEE